MARYTVVGPPRKKEDKPKTDWEEMKPPSKKVAIKKKVKPQKGD